MPKRKPNVMSEQRAALMRANWPSNRECTPEAMQKLHDELTKDFDKLASVYGEGLKSDDNTIILEPSIVLTGDKEVDGNNMLLYYFVSVKQRAKDILNRRIASLQFAGPFYEVFRLQLCRYWSPYTGFDCLKFDEVLQSGDRSINEVVQERYGDRGLKIVKILSNPSGHESELDYNTGLTFPKF